MQKSRLTLADVRRHRQALYGFAALWIMLNHMTYSPPGAAMEPVRLFKIFGVCGVEMFVLLSGFGLHGSIERSASVGAFYKKRFARVFAVAFLIGAVAFGLEEGGVLRYGAQLTFFSYWLGVGSFWYVPFILTMYLLYPAVYALQQKNPRTLWLLLGLSLIPAVGVCLMDNGWADVTRRGVCRIPVFLLGCIAAPHVNRGASVPRWAIPASLAASAALLLPASRMYGGAFGAFPNAYFFVRTLGYTCLGAFVILALTGLFRRLVRCGAGRFVYRLLALCGGVSLEIYLLFNYVEGLLLAHPVYASGGGSMIKLELLAALLTVIASLLAARLCRFLMDAFERTTVPEEEQAAG